MPELPEIQAHAERLTDEFAGATLQRFQPLSFVALKTAVPPPDAAYGRALDEVGRRGKYLLVRFGDHTFVVHLMQGGRLKPDEKQAAKPRFGVARWRFDDGRAWLLTEQGTERKAGVWVLAGEVDGQDPARRARPGGGHARPRRAGCAAARPSDAPARLPARPAAAGRPRPAPGQRGVLDRVPVAVRLHRQAEGGRRRGARRRPSAAAWRRASPTSASDRT